MKRTLVLAAVSALVLTSAVCGGNDADGKSGTDPDATLVIERVAGNGQTVAAGGVVEPIVRVKRGGEPLQGATVRFAVQSGDGTVAYSSVVNGIDGTARTFWLLGPEPEDHELMATVEDESVEFSATTTALVPGEAVMGRNEYIEYVPGELPIILSAPHGGSLRPTEIADRTEGVTGADLNTADLTLRISRALEERTGKRPHVILSHLHRSKLDPNREIEEAAQGDLYAERAWFEYHRWIETAAHVVERDHGRGFYVDVHGHGHAIQRLEIGYLLTGNDLARPNEELDGDTYVNKSSIAKLAREVSIDFSDLIRGEQSLGEMLVRRGYPAVPSASDPHPAGAPYFTGGYSTVRHGSRDGGVIDGVQIEHNFDGVRDTPENREAYAAALAEAILEFLDVHAGLSLAGPVVSSSDAAGSGVR